MEERGGVGAHEAQRERRTGCVTTGGLVKLGSLMMDQEVDARTVAEEVWFWDKSLKGETEDTSEWKIKNYRTSWQKNHIVEDWIMKNDVNVCYLYTWEGQNIRNTSHYNVVQYNNTTNKMTAELNQHLFNTVNKLWNSISFTANPQVSQVITSLCK